MTAVSDKVVWKIKKEDFEKGDFGDCKFQLGGFQWYIGNSSYRTNARSDKVAYFGIFWNSLLYTSTSFFNVHHSGCFTLLGFNGKHDAVHKWSAIAHDNSALHIDLTFDSSALSFAEKYLFPGGTYHLEFQLTVKDFSVDFGSPNHKLLLSDADTGCLQIDEQKLYLSKSYLSTISPYFKALFFGDLKIKNQEVIILVHIDLENFMQFLAHSYTMFSNHRDVDNVGEVLELADKYQCDSVFVSCEELLEKQSYLNIHDLKLSNKYSYKLIKVSEKTVATLPVKELKKYLAEIISDPDSEYVRRLITERFEDEVNERKHLEDEANKRKRVCTCTGKETQGPKAKC